MAAGKGHNERALKYHSSPRPGKWEISPTKPMNSAVDLALAYSPGVAAPVEAIAQDADEIYRYTNKGNTIAVVSNGTAVLGLGNVGAHAAKPVMEGKCVLFKRFADLDAVDLEIDTADPDAFVNCVRYLGPAFGGVNLEDIKAPESIIIEDKLRSLMDIPVFHDDRHGTAVVVAAGLLNAIELSAKKLEDVRVVVAGAGSAAMAVIDLIITIGVQAENIIVCDEHGVLNTSRTDLDKWRMSYAQDTALSTLCEAFKGADVAIGLSTGGVFSPDMITSMAERPIIFALANPVPEIYPEEARAVKPDAIIATGRSDYPNQVNNVLCFPFIFRGAMDVRATEINEAMKVAAARALAKLARNPAATNGNETGFRSDDILPSVFEPRLNAEVSSAVAEAAILSGVARCPIGDLEKYRAGLRREPSAELELSV